MPHSKKAVANQGTVVCNKQSFRVIAFKKAGPNRKTREAAEADLEYARGAASRAEFEARLRKLHERIMAASREASLDQLRRARQGVSST